MLNKNVHNHCETSYQFQADVNIPTNPFRCSINCHWSKQRCFESIEGYSFFDTKKVCTTKR